MRLAVVTPLDSCETGVADYSLDLLPHLAQVAGSEIAVFSEDRQAIGLNGGEGWARRSIVDLPPAADEFDLIIYQMGNSPAHDFMAPHLFRHPGLIVLHDVSLHDFFARQAVRYNRPSVYLRAFGFGYGTNGTRLARQYLRQPMPIGYPEYLLSEWLAVRSPGVIVHSRHAASMLGERCPSARIWTMPMPMPVPEAIPKAEARSGLRLDPAAYLIAVFGVLNESKNPLAVLDALARLRADGIPAQAVFIGLENSSFQLWPEVERRGLQAHIFRLGFVEDADQVRLWLSAADIAVGLRSMYWGETPSSALRVLALGAPMIVNAVGAFAELPDAACVKLPPDAPDMALAVLHALADLYRQPDRLQAMGEAARQHMAHEHDPDRVASAYLGAIKSILSIE